MAICAQCERCGRLATKDLKWVLQLYDLQAHVQGEELLCVCGNKIWKFVEREQSELASDVLVLDKVVLKN